MKYGLLGETLGHSFSPILHNKLGDYSYELFERKEFEIKDLIKDPEIAGLNVTIPYKQRVMDFCDKIHEDAKEIGAVNTLVKKEGKVIGYNTDIDGFLYMVEASGIEIAGKKVLILGGGSTSKTIHRGLEKLEAGEILKFSRRGDLKFQDLKKHQDGQVIVNCTPVGMYPNNLQSLVDLKDFPKLEGVLDVVYNPLRTDLILQAQELRIKNRAGLEMLVVQAKVASEYFQGKKIPEEISRQVYLEILSQETNIILVGMPGSGKTTVGKKISKLLNRTFIDTDEEIVKKEGRTIPQIMEKEGMDYFRQVETEVLKEVGKQNGSIIATGGGVVLFERNYWPLKQNGRIYFLKRSLRSLSTRGRPLSKGGLPKLKKLYKERLPLYESFADATVRNTHMKITTEKIIGDFHENISD